MAKFCGDRPRDRPRRCGCLKKHLRWLNISPSGTVVPGGLISNNATGKCHYARISSRIFWKHLKTGIFFHKQHEAPEQTTEGYAVYDGGGVSTASEHQLGLYRVPIKTQPNTWNVIYPKWLDISINRPNFTKSRSWRSSTNVGIFTALYSLSLPEMARKQKSKFDVCNSTA